MSHIFKSAVNYLSGGESDEFVGVSIDVDGKRLAIKSILGDGGFGKVYHAVSMSDGGDFALKRLFVPEGSIKKIQQEIAILRKVSTHPNICSFITGAAHPVADRRGYAEYLILLEYCPGNLCKIIKSAGTKLFSSTEVLRLFHGVCAAVSHLHSLAPAVIHRDLKAENVILSTNGTVKLCDFGSATTTVICPTEDWSAQQRGMLEDEVQTNTTPCFRAPEMIDYYSNYEIGTKADVWALGCFLYYICYFELPYDDNKLAIVNAKYQQPNEHLVMFAPFLPIIRGVFKVNPAQRPTVKQIISLLESIAKEKNIDHTLPPFDDFQVRITASNNIPPTPVNNPQSNNHVNNGKSSWIGYLKGGAENILKEAKSASEKVVGVVVQASSLYTNERIDEGQLMITAVTSRIVAISFPDPATLETVEQMVMSRYGRNAYFFNLTPNEYPKEAFGGRMMNCGWSPLVAPSMKSIIHLTDVMDRWLLVAPENIIIVHCQTGTGNTALAVGTYFLVSGLYKSATSALNFYGASRYPNTAGFINPSQRRCVEYVEQMLYNKDVEPHSHTVILCDLILSAVPLFSINRSSCKPFLEVYENGKKILSTLREPDVMKTYQSSEEKLLLPINMGVKGDIRVAVYHARNFIGGKMSAIRMFQFCFNTSFVDCETSSIRLPKARLDAITQHDKFPGKFFVELSLSVQVDKGTAESPYTLAASSFGIKPPVCCPTNEEFNSILSKVPDKGVAERKESVSSVKLQNHIVYEEEKQDASEDSNLIDILSASLDEGGKPAPMSDPMSRKSPGKDQGDVLLDLLAPQASPLTQSNSAPNLAEMNSPPTAQTPVLPTADEFADFLSGAPAPAPAPKTHKRDKSVNLMDISGNSQDDLINNFDVLASRTASVSINKPKPASPPTLSFDPFAPSTTGPAKTPEVPDPFLTPRQNMPRAQPLSSNMGSPLIPTKLGGTNSGYNSPVRSRPTSPAASPSLPRKPPSDPFSDFRIDPKAGQVQFDRNAGPATAAPSQPAFKPTQQAAPKTQMRPNYFASTHVAGSVFGGETKPWQQHSNATKDTFGDLLSEQNFSVNQPTAKTTLQEQRREELEKSMDPIELKIMDWTKGKENNIRALLSTLGDVLWDGETRWPKPGMHLMIEPGQVKKMYRNASRVVHPDKQVGTSNEELAKRIQMELNGAYYQFEDSELH